MKPDKRFLDQPKNFWANVRIISQTTGYVYRSGSNKGQIKVPTEKEIQSAMNKVGLVSSHLLDEENHPTALGETLLSYFEYRASVLNDVVKPKLMDAERAKRVFEELRENLSPTCPIPINKQKGAKKEPNYFTGIINMLIEANAAGLPCDYNPRKLPVVTLNDTPLRVFARQIDGAFTSLVNPIAVWEIKEYYYTTTFGSRVAGGVYETLLDGMELEELRKEEGIEIKHYLMVDDYFTWWVKGRSYLCRIADMLHMGYVDEVLFGYEVVERMPSLVKEWVTIARKQAKDILKN